MLEMLKSSRDDFNILDNFNVLENFNVSSINASITMLRLKG